VEALSGLIPDGVLTNWAGDYCQGRRDTQKHLAHTSLPGYKMAFPGLYPITLLWPMTMKELLGLAGDDERVTGAAFKGYRSKSGPGAASFPCGFGTRTESRFGARQEAGRDDADSEHDR
jgi:hypothetical protein